MFTVLNKANENITIIDKTGVWKMDFPADTEDQFPQIALSFKKQIVFTAHATGASSSGGNQGSEEQLYINGVKELTIDANSISSIKGLVVHKEGMSNLFF